MCLTLLKEDTLIRSLFFLFKEFSTSMRENLFVLLTYSSQVTISMMVLGIFVVGSVNVAHYIELFRNIIDVNVYIEKTASKSELDEIKKYFSQMKSDGSIKGFEYYSPDEALRNLYDKSAVNLADLEDDNPLPHKFVLKPVNILEIEELTVNLKKLPKFMDVKYGKKAAEQIARLLWIFQFIFIAAIGIMLTFCVSSIVNIIRLSIYARRTEIRIMKLVGATDTYTSVPFVIEGLIFGLIGSFIAYVIIYFLYFAIVKFVADWNLPPQLCVPVSQLNPLLLSILMGIGSLVGIWGSTHGISKYLKEVY